MRARGEWSGGPQRTTAEPARATFRTLMAEWIAVFYPMRRAEIGAEDDLC